MQTINTTQAPRQLDAAEMRQAGGGAAYIKFDGIDGKVVESRSSPILMLRCASGQF